MLEIISSILELLSKNLPLAVLVFVCPLALPLFYRLKYKKDNIQQTRTQTQIEGGNVNYLSLFVFILIVVLAISILYFNSYHTNLASVIDISLTPTSTSVPPTSTSVPPTNTPVPPTNTPVPPTNTPVPPTNTLVPPTATPTITAAIVDTSVICPDYITREKMKEWLLGEKKSAEDIPPYIDDFNSYRSKGGNYSVDVIIPANVVIATDFGAGNSLVWQRYPVKPLVHYRSSGVFETTGEFKAPHAGACMSIIPDTATDVDSSFIPPTVAVVPALLPREGSLNCSFMDELATKVDILQWIDIPSGSGRLAGAQIRTISTTNIPEGWIVQRGAGDEYGPIDLPANIVASVYSPEICRPLAKPSAPDLNCTFIDVLRAQSIILQLIEIPPGSGRLAGLQIRTNSSIDVPNGWIVQRGAGDEYGPINLPADIVASIYSPESCRPLK